MQVGRYIKYINVQVDSNILILKYAYDFFHYASKYEEMNTAQENKQWHSQLLSTSKKVQPRIRGKLGRS